MGWRGLVARESRHTRGRHSAFFVSTFFCIFAISFVIKRMYEVTEYQEDDGGFVSMVTILDLSPTQ